jgi:hypothetical protein
MLFLILKAIAKSKGTLIAMAFKSDKYRKGNKGKRQINYTKN